MGLRFRDLSKPLEQKNESIRRHFASLLKKMTQLTDNTAYLAFQSGTQEGMVEVCQLLIKAGIDIIDVSSGIGGWNRPKDRRGEGYLVSESTFLKQADLGVPIIGVGGIESAEYIDQAVNNSWLDLAAVGRAILKDPLAFNQQIMQQEVSA